MVEYVAVEQKMYSTVKLSLYANKQLAHKWLYYMYLAVTKHCEVKPLKTTTMHNCQSTYMRLHGTEEDALLGLEENGLLELEENGSC